MHFGNGLHLRTFALVCALILSTQILAFAVQGNPAYVRLNLVSDIRGLARNVDPNLVNPWGIARSDSGPIWVSNAGTGTSTVYFGNGKPFPSAENPLVVTIPPASKNPGHGLPSGIVFNSSTDAFLVSNAEGASGQSVFVFATLDGTLSGWSPSVDFTNALLTVEAPSAVYTGLAIAHPPAGSRLYAADFAGRKVDIYDEGFSFVGSFGDPSLPDYGPFGVQELDGLIYVAFAKVDPFTGMSQFGDGLGYVDVFNTEGELLAQLIAEGPLNAPWGMALAPSNFGIFSNALLVGNFGNGRINAFDPTTGAHLGVLSARSSSLFLDGFPIAVEFLWGLSFGNGGDAGRTNDLFFAAGIRNEEHGLFGKILPDPRTAGN